VSHYDDAYEADAEKRQRELNTVRGVVMLRLNEAIALLNAAERSREHSIAITHIETAVRWLR
jgi:hypothetical protein